MARHLDAFSSHPRSSCNAPYIFWIITHSFLHELIEVQLTKSSNLCMTFNKTVID